jgi:hypothetical protein
MAVVQTSDIKMTVATFSVEIVNCLWRKFLKNIQLCLKSLTVEHKIPRLWPREVYNHIPLMKIVQASLIPAHR